MKRIVLSFSFACALFSGFAQKDPEKYAQIITAADLKAKVYLLAGDQGLVVTELEQLPALGLNSQQARPLHYGTPLATLCKMKLSQSQLQFAVGELVGNTDEQLGKVKVGDFVRFDVAR